MKIKINIILLLLCGFSFIYLFDSIISGEYFLPNHKIVESKIVGFSDFESNELCQFIRNYSINCNNKSYKINQTEYAYIYYQKKFYRIYKYNDYKDYIIFGKYECPLILLNKTYELNKTYRFAIHYDNNKLNYFYDDSDAIINRENNKFTIICSSILFLVLFGLYMSIVIKNYRKIRIYNINKKFDLPMYHDNLSTRTL
jgi:hypothetical protein